MLQFEAFGFCKPGEGVQFIRDHDFSYNGDLPLNTGGGQISAGQAACSSHNLVEAVRQLRGEGGKRQVKDTRNALVTGHRLDQLRTQLGLERGPGSGPGISEAIMAKAFNDTLGVKRTIKHFDFSEPYWEGDEAEEARHPVLQGNRQVPALSASGEHLHRPAARYRMARGLRQGRGVFLHHHVTAARQPSAAPSPTPW